MIKFQPKIQTQILHYGEIEIDQITRTVKQKGELIPASAYGKRGLQPAQYAVLVILIESNGQFITREQIYDRMFGSSRIGLAHKNSVIAVHVSRLRQSLKQPNIIESEYGKGYRLLTEANPNKMPTTRNGRIRKVNPKGSIVEPA